MQWIHYFRYFTMHTLSVSRIHYQYREFTLLLANSLWIYLVFYNSFWIFTNLLSIERIHFECSINSLRLDIIWMVSHNAIEIGIRWLTLSFCEPSKLYLVLVFRLFPMDLLSFSWIHYEFTIFFANLLWILTFIRKFIMPPFSVYRELAMNSFLRISWLFRENTTNKLSV